MQVVGRTSQRLLDPTGLLPQFINVDCLIHGVLRYTCCLGWVWTLVKRTEIRERFGIPGTAVEDCVTAYFCECCAVVQHDNEVVARMPRPVDIIKDQPLPVPGMSITGPAK
ncbi:hypothetical protein F5Y17DRAFT_455964 [Xylariaceae sp. FL0594]|nr:hypothetical protein F5Y17DRAFT_455964 [Xylariaceae sp. FL0594]